MRKNTIALAYEFETLLATRALKSEFIYEENIYANIHIMEDKRNI